MKYNTKYGVVAALTMAAFVAPSVGAVQYSATVATLTTDCTATVTGANTTKVEYTGTWGYTKDENVTATKTEDGYDGVKTAIKAGGTVTAIPVAFYESQLSSLNNVCAAINTKVVAQNDAKKALDEWANTKSIKVDEDNAYTFNTKDDTKTADDTFANRYPSGNAVTVTANAKLTNEQVVLAYEYEKAYVADAEDALATLKVQDAGTGSKASNIKAKEADIKAHNEIITKLANAGAVSMTTKYNSLISTYEKAVKANNDNTTTLSDAVKKAQLAMAEKDFQLRESEVKAAKAADDAAKAKVTAAGKDEEAKAAAAQTALKNLNSFKEDYASESAIDSDPNLSDAEKTAKKTQLRDLEKALADAQAAQTAATKAKTDAQADYTAGGTGTKLSTAEGKRDTAYTAYQTAYNAIETDTNKQLPANYADYAKSEAAKEEEEANQSIASASVSGVSRAYTYTGKAIKLSVKVVSKDGKTLTAGTDYTVSYSNNTKVGTATITISGKGEYTGTVTKSFYIDPAKSSIKKIAVAAKKMTVTVKKGTAASGVQIAYRVKGTNKWSYVKTTGTSKTISSLKKGKKYQVVVRSYTTKSGKVTNYSGWSATKTTAKIK